MAKDFTSQAGIFLQAEAEKKAPAKSKSKANKPDPTKADNIPIGYALKPESKSKRLNLLIRPSIYEALKDKAQAAGTSVNDYINEILTKEVQG